MEDLDFKSILSHSTTLWIHFLLMNLIVNIIALMPQSQNIPIQTPMAPICATRIR